MLPITPSLSNLKTVLTNQRVVGSIEFFDPSALVEIRRRAQGDSLHRSSVSFLAPIISLSFSKVAAPRRVVEAFLSPQRGSYSAFCFEDEGPAGQTRKIAPAPFPAQWKAGLRSEKLIERPFVKHAVLVRFLTKGIVVLMRCVPHFNRKRSLVPLERRRGDAWLCASLSNLKISFDKPSARAA